MRSPRSLLRIVPNILIARLGLAACGDGASAGSDPALLDVASKAFLGNNITVDDKPLRLVKGSQLRLSFDTDSIGATGGCNSMSGAATWANSTLRVADDSLAMTEMACDQPLMDQDAWFATILTASPTLSQQGDSLTLVSGSTVIVLTDEETAIPDASLTGTTWTLESIATGDTVSTVPVGVRVSLQFNHDGTLSANLGCNTGRGDYTVSETSISFGTLATTKMACEPPASDVEQMVSDVLRNDVDFVIAGKTLSLAGRDRATGAPSGLTYRAETP